MTSEPAPSTGLLSGTPAEVRGAGTVFLSRSDVERLRGTRKYRGRLTAIPGHAELLRR